MSKKKAISRKHGRIAERERIRAEKATGRRVMEAAEDDGPELDEQPKRADIESLRHLRKTIAKFDKSYRTQLLEILVEIYRQSWDLQAGSMKVWKAFLTENFFANKKLSNPKKEIRNVFQHVCEYGFDAKTAADRKRTCKFSRTLKYYNAIGVKPDDLIFEIKKAGGLEKAYSLSVEHHKTKSLRESSIVASAKGEADKPSENGGTSDDKGVLEEADDQPHVAVTFDTGGTSKKSKKSEKFVMKRHLRERLHDVQDGQEVILICVFLGEDDQGRARLKVREVTPTKIAKD